MNEKQHPPRTEEEVRSILRDRPRPAPDPAFRERNRRMFTGEIPYEIRETSRFERLTPVRRIWGGVGLAAAAGLAVFFLLTGDAPEWTVSEASAVGAILVDGDETAPNELVGRTLSSGTRLRSCDMGSVTLTVPGAVSFVLGPGAEATVGGTRSALGTASLSARVHRGMTMGSTGPGFPSGGLRIETDVATVMVHGTTFAVECTTDTVCVCVLEGSVEVEFRDGRDPAPVLPEHQLFIPRSGNPTGIQALAPDQRKRLLAVREGASPWE